ncbi:uncharacterized protein LOC129575256 [Sitodiplosis mosellana]|uniref:uncharacterized protein LOC129575256 n=1 Tax=Sitodiplosis mosellana TaxID=263140 RepID=UPI0024439AE1|nr:uncharacterized protein LOC129575256 [Sitodiplosis mosellana]XP_055314397.1 uncharacterized protein LOC129575256 [Sitodiplosis mosellana]
MRKEIKMCILNIFVAIQLGVLCFVLARNYPIYESPFAITWFLFNLLVALALCLLTCIRREPTNRKNKLWYDVIAFVLCEVCDLLSVIMFLRVCRDIPIDRWVHASNFLWISVVSSLKLMSMVNHLMLIHYTIFGTQEQLLQRTATHRVILYILCCTIGYALLVKSFLSIFYETDFLIIFSIIIIAMKHKHYLSKGNESNAENFLINRIMTASNQKMYWESLCFLPFTVLFLFKEYAHSRTETESKIYREQIKRQTEEFLPYILVVAVALGFSFVRDAWIKERIDPHSRWIQADEEVQI